MALIIPLLFICVIVFAAVKKINVYNSFTKGVGDAVQFTLTLLPMLAAIFMMCEIFESSGLSDAVSNALAPAFRAMGIPEQLSKLVLIKPFSGSGSLTYLNKIISENGADSYAARCACVLYGSSETVFYISAVYFASVKSKRSPAPIIIVLFANLAAAVFACLICKIM